MACRVKLASIAALVISLPSVALVAWYYKLNVNPPVSAEYGLSMSAGNVRAVVVCRLSSVIVALAADRSRRRVFSLMEPVLA